MQWLFYFSFSRLTAKMVWCVFRGSAVSRIRAFASMVLFSICISFSHPKVEKCVPYHTRVAAVRALYVCACVSSLSAVRRCVIKGRKEKKNQQQQQQQQRRSIAQHILRWFCVDLSVSSHWLCCWYFWLVCFFVADFFVFVASIVQHAIKSLLSCATVASRYCANIIDNRFLKLSYFFRLFLVLIISNRI